MHESNSEDASESHRCHRVWASNPRNPKHVTGKRAHSCMLGHPEVFFYISMQRCRAHLLQALELAVQARDGRGLGGVGAGGRHRVDHRRRVHVGAAHRELQRRLALAEVVGVRVEAREEVRARVAAQRVLHPPHASLQCYRTPCSFMDTAIMISQQ